ncbi:copper resistance protein CopC [Phycicoccus sp.]|uniref:copper resistance CopC/CopD family protein n=1 Tax=Phycicoccus sp. TaxID=1902410 RepID=UPI002C2BCFED|nr:copper resistance protein CopC [Phycicoccus sp.]HMM94072.1 copper resistance protein CopC [Phycicoccus sp.]
MTSPTRPPSVTPPAARGRRVLPRLGQALLVALLLLVGAAGAASAHATLERSDPPNGGMVATGRTTLTLWYGESITPSASTFTLEGDTARVPVTVAVDADRRVVHLTTPPLEKGTYTLSWAVVAADGHPTRGTVVFGSGFRPDGLPGSDSALPPPTPVLLRSLDLGGTLLALGSLLALRRVVPLLGPLSRRTGRRVLTLGATGATLAVVAAVATPLVTTASQVGASVGSGEWTAALGQVLLDSTWGRLWIARLLALVVAYLALWTARRSAARGVARPALVASAALVVSVALDAWAGHASALPSGVVLVWVAATAHVLAAGVWAGGLLVLALVLRPLALLDRDGRAGVALAAWRSFSPVAAVASGTLLATGVFEAGAHVGTWAALFRGVYGPAVLAKVAVVGVALGIAAYNTLVVNPRVAGTVGRVLGLGSAWRPRPHPLRTTVLVEGLVLVLAVGVAAVMTSVPTAREVTSAITADAPQSDRVDGLFVTVDAVPTGEEVRLVVRAQAVVKPLGTPVTGVEVGVTRGVVTAPRSLGEQRVTLTQTEPGRYEARIPDPGVRDWTAEVFLHREGGRTSVVLAPWSSGTDWPVLRVVTTLVALGLILMVTSGVVLVRRRKHLDYVPAGPRRSEDLRSLEKVASR